MRIAKTDTTVSIRWDALNNTGHALTHCACRLIGTHKTSLMLMTLNRSAMAALAQLHFTTSLYLAKLFWLVNRDAVVQWPGVSNPGAESDKPAGRVYRWTNANMLVMRQEGRSAMCYIWQHIFCRHLHSWQSSTDHRETDSNAINNQELNYLVWWRQQLSQSTPSMLPHLALCKPTWSKETKHQACRTAATEIFKVSYLYAIDWNVK